jgi:hypothetical protein
MGVVLVLLLPTVFFLLLDAILYRKPPSWLTAAVANAWKRVRPPREVPFDPFDALIVQHRLAALAAEIQRLEDDHLVFAKAHRIKVAQSAYDALLMDACRLAGVEPVASEIGNPNQRAREEMELASRGWFW